MLGKSHPWHVKKTRRGSEKIYSFSDYISFCYSNYMSSHSIYDNDTQFLHVLLSDYSRTIFNTNIHDTLFMELDQTQKEFAYSSLAEFTSEELESGERIFWRFLSQYQLLPDYNSAFCHFNTYGSRNKIILVADDTCQSVVSKILKSRGMQLVGGIEAREALDFDPFNQTQEEDIDY